ncbi:MAG: 30S ribosomal protein THX [Saprospiraceae bacterium]|nr:30S ribosomal protein THX [Saprospiraceae bacterium]
MGKGDKRSKRGKIIRGSYGNSRPSKSLKTVTTATGEAKKSSKKTGNKS